MSYIIYKHTNILNGKIYIGQTKHSMKRRWNQHVAGAKRNSTQRFHQALRKHGTECWDHSVIEIVETVEEANERERFWICESHSIEHAFGYNTDWCGKNYTRKLFDESHCQKISESNQRYWDNNPNDVRKTQLTERNKSPESIAKSKEAQTRRWAKPESREHIRALWADPIWRAKTLESRRKAKELKLQQSSS